MYEEGEEAFAIDDACIVGKGKDGELLVLVENERLVIQSEDIDARSDVHNVGDFGQLVISLAVAQQLGLL